MLKLSRGDRFHRELLSIDLDEDALSLPSMAWDGEGASRGNPGAAQDNAGKVGGIPQDPPVSAIMSYAGFRFPMTVLRGISQDPPSPSSFPPWNMQTDANAHIHHM